MEKKFNLFKRLTISFERLTISFKRITILFKRITISFKRITISFKRITILTYHRVITVRDGQGCTNYCLFQFRIFSRDILASLTFVHGYIISQRHLRRLLKKLHFAS